MRIKIILIVVLVTLCKGGIAYAKGDTVYININDIEYKKSESIAHHNNGTRNIPIYGFAMICNNCPVKEISFMGYVDTVKKDFAPVQIIDKQKFNKLRFSPAKETIDSITLGTKYLRDKIFFVEKYGRRYKIYEVKFFQPWDD